METTRNDTHSPTNLVTEDYEYLFCFDNQQPGFLIGVDLDWWKSITNWDPALDGRGIHQCHHCGARLRYGVILRHVPSGYAIVVGETCAENRFERATAEFHKMRKAAALDRKAQRIVKAREEWFAADASRQVAYDFCVARLADNDFGWEGTYHNFVHKINRYGDTSDKFVAMILRAKDRHENREAEKAEEAKVPAPEGRLEFQGEVVSRKYHDNDFGGAMKITVKVTEPKGVWLVWVTEPSSLECEKGDTVKMTATLSRSDRDESFAFGKRPTKAEVVS